jgi:hypothetical protein
VRRCFSPICGENYVAACGRPYLSSGIVDFGLLEAMWRERGLTMVLVTHDSSIARRAQRIGVMKYGRLGFRQSPPGQAARVQAADLAAVNDADVEDDVGNRTPPSRDRPVPRTPAVVPRRAGSQPPGRRRPMRPGRRRPGPVAGPAPVRPRIFGV